MNADIIIPTWNNLTYLIPCVGSILQNTVSDPFRIIVVNNGEPEHSKCFKEDPRLKILQQTENVGWERGLVAGLKVSDAPFVLFMNDDTFIPASSSDWLTRLLSHFDEPDCAAVGPSSNVVMGKQNIFAPVPENLIRAKFLIGFCEAVRRADLDAVGGIDESLPGGDDLDLSIRLRDLGKRLLIDRNVFVYHHGFKTGERVEGGPNQTGGWNSIDKIERTNHALIRKHGLFKFLDLWNDYGL
jgi:GT2 family glycosyltransferase